jgi:PST family polysaccharide transporter
VLPLIPFLYLFRVLGEEKCGLIIFAQGCVQYFVILTDYGFAFSATRDISTHRMNPAEVAAIFSGVFVVKLALLALSFLVLLGLVAVVPEFAADPWIYLFMFGVVVGQVLFPAWFFQGIERMEFVALLNLLAKLLFTLLIFVVVRREEDYLLVPLMNSLGSVVAGTLGLLIALTKFRVRPVLPSRQTLVQQVKASGQIFVAKAATSLYTSSNVVILGFFAGYDIVACYGSGEKIVCAVQGLLLPFSQAGYPYISRLASESPARALHFIRRVTWPLIAVAAGLSLLLLVAAPLIGRIGFGDTSGRLARVIQIQSFLPLIVGVATLYANFFLLGFGYARVWSRIIVFSGSLGLVGAIVLVGVLHTEHVGLSVSVVLTECLVQGLSYVAYRQRKERVPGGTVRTEEVSDPNADRGFIFSYIRK